MMIPIAGDCVVGEDGLDSNSGAYNVTDTGPAGRALESPGSQKPRIRLGKDHFIALRSLVRGRWVQGQQFEWKYNREWRLVGFGDVPALDVVWDLMEMGLAEKSVCCEACQRDAFQITEKGRDIVYGSSHAIGRL
ncbi:TPA: hypothetical protein ACWLUJ_005708 [Pseudomonas aeruginosa]|nr:hypothetical protein [Pseudomonas aeruginosa]